MFRENRNKKTYLYDTALLKQKKQKRGSVAGILAALLVLSLLAAVAVFVIWGGQWDLPKPWLDRLPLPKHLSSIEVLRNGIKQTVAEGGTIQLNPRDTLAIVKIHTDGWFSRWVRLQCNDLDPKRLRQTPVRIGDFISASDLNGPKKVEIQAHFLTAYLGRIWLLIRLDSQDWKDKAAASVSQDEKIRYLHKALESDPGNTLIKMQLAALFTKRKQFRLAADQYREVLKLGRSGTVLEKLLNVYRQWGQVNQALNVYLELLQLDPGPVLFKEFLDYLQNHTSSAKTVLFLEQHAKQIPPSLRGAYYLFLAQAYTDSSSWAQAADAYQKALKAGSKDPNIYYNLSVAAEQSANTEEAIRSLQRYLKVSVEDIESWLRLAKLFEKKGDKKSERKVCERVLALDPANEEALLRLVNLLDKDSGSEALISAYEKLAKLKPDDLVIQYNLAVLYYRTEDWTRATRAFAKVAEKDPDDVKSRKYLLDLYTREKNDAGQIKELNELLRFEPDNKAYYDALIAIHNSRKNYQEMAAVAQKAVAKFPENVAFHRYLLVSNLQLGDRNAALETLETLIALEPKEKKYLQQAARLYEEQKNYDAALQKVKQIMQLDPGDEQAQEDYLRLGRIKLGATQE